MKKLLQKLSIGVLMSGLIFSVGISKASAAIPVDASLSPASQTYTADAKNVTKKLSWGGGISSTYYVDYYNGITTSTYDPQANYYTAYDTSYYNKGSLTTKTWNTRLYVSNGSSDTAYGSVTLKD